MRANPDKWVIPYEYEQDGPEPWFPIIGNYTYNALYRTYSSVQTLDYHERKRLRQLPDNPYTMDLIRCKASSRFYTRTRQGFTVASTEVHHTGTTPFDGRFPELKTDAKNKATRKLYKAVDGVKVNYAQFLAERKQTASLLASTATRIYTAARALRRADLKGFATSLSLGESWTRSQKQLWRRVERTPAHQRISNHWLEYVYGWRPLLQDCFGTAELLAEQISTDPSPEGELRVSASVNSRFVLRGSVPSGAEGGVILQNRDDSHICSARIRAQYRLDDEARSLLNKTGISNPLLLAWELIPYSFVVDWFVPVGTYLESLTAMDGFTMTRGTISTQESAVSNRWLTFVNHTGLYSAYGWDFVEAWRSGPTVECTQVRYTRTPTTSFPYALKVRSPIGGEPLTRLTTALALLAPLFGRKPTYTPRMMHLPVNQSWSDIRYLRGDN